VDADGTNRAGDLVNTRHLAAVVVFRFSGSQSIGDAGKCGATMEKRATGDGGR
jgi:hypothetical protein